MGASFYLHVLVILGAATLLACWCGWGLARLALPASLQPYRALLAPLIGYAFVVVWGYWCVRTVAGLAVALPVALAFTGALNALAWRRGGPQRLVAREYWPLLGLLLATVLVGILPLLRYGHPAVIGAGWDTENYLPTARYLERGPLAAIAAAPPNPLRDINAHPPRIGLTLGFSVWQGSVDLLARAEALASFAPLLAWLRALGVLAVYVLLRATMGLGCGAALLGAAWTSAGALLLWVSYFNFGMQLAAWPLIPLGLILGLAAVESQPLRLDNAKGTEPQSAQRAQRAGDGGAPQPSGLDNARGTEPQSAQRAGSRWGVALLAAMVLAALPVAYYPALTIWAPLALGLGLARLIEVLSAAGAIMEDTGRRSPASLRSGWFLGVSSSRLVPVGRLLLAALALGSLATLLAAPTIVDYWEGFAYRYSSQLTTLGVFRYIPATDILGLTPFLHTQPETPLPTLWALLGLAALVALMLAGLVLPGVRSQGSGVGGQGSGIGRLNTQTSARVRWLGLAIGGLAYLAWLRWGQQYPYAYMKGSAYAGFVFLALAAAGWQAIALHVPRRWLPLVGAPALLLLAQMGASQARIVAAHWQAPGLYAGELPALLELRRIIPAGSSARLTSDPRARGVTAGLAAYLLDHTAVFGATRTGYAIWASDEPDALPEYALLLAAEDPAPWGYHDPIWRGGSFALYRRSAGALAHLRAGQNLAPGEELTVSVGGERLRMGQADLEGGLPRRIELAVATLQEGEITLNGRSFAIPPGSALIRIATFSTPQPLEVRNTGSAPLLLRSLTLAEATSAPGNAVEPERAALVVGERVEAAASVVTTTLDLLLPDSGPVALALDIWDSAAGRHYGWYGFEVAASPAVQRVTLALDLASGTARAHDADGAERPLGAQFGGLREGRYSARLQAIAGSTLLAEPIELFTFSVTADGAIAGLELEPQQPLVLATTTDRPPQPLDVQLGEDVRLKGYDLPRRVIHVGEPIELALWWEALAAGSDERSVLVHLLGPDGAKMAQADGTPAGGARPTSQWRIGEVIVDRRRIEVPADLPPGEYTLAIGMYRWPSLERLPLLSSGQRQPDDVLRIPIVVER